MSRGSFTNATILASLCIGLLSERLLFRVLVWVVRSYDVAFEFGREREHFRSLLVLRKAWFLIHT